MLWDTLYIEQNNIRVTRNSDVGKILNILLYIIPVVCAVICYAVIRNVEALWKYLTIPACMLFFGMYKFYYLPSQETDDVLLRVQRGKLIYVEPEAKYIIPIASIDHIKDESVYFDFRERGSSGWDHSIVIQIKESCSITKVTSDGDEAKIRCLASAPLSVAITYLQLEHEDHEKLYEKLQKTITTHKEM